MMRSPVAFLAIVALILAVLSFAPPDTAGHLLRSLGLMVLLCLVAVGLGSVTAQVRLWWIRRSIRRMR